MSEKLKGWETSRGILNVEALLDGTKAKQRGTTEQEKNDSDRKPEENPKWGRCAIQTMKGDRAFNTKETLQMPKRNPENILEKPGLVVVSNAKLTPPMFCAAYFLLVGREQIRMP